jgi:hypothetical protein
MILINRTEIFDMCSTVRISTSKELAAVPGKHEAFNGTPEGLNVAGETARLAG